MDERGLRRLLDVGRSLLTELDPETVLERVLDVARELTGARYAAIGVLDERRETLERFLTAGIAENAHRAIGALPGGRGVLGVLIAEPRPLRLRDVGAHPYSFGFPLAHPPMTTFLGVPIVIEGQAWGNLYLTEKAGGEFTHDDEESAVVLADWAAIAIGNARLTVPSASAVTSSSAPRAVLRRRPRSLVRSGARPISGASWSWWSSAHARCSGLASWRSRSWRATSS